MRALTLWEPWASLVASKDKQAETRSWGTDYRGKLLITAAAKKLTEEDRAIAKSLILALGYEEGTFKINRGCVVAVCDLVGCVRMTREFIFQQSKKEIMLGDWRIDRYAWILENVVDLSHKKIAIKGKQGLWTPDENQRKGVMAIVNSCHLTV